MSKKQINKRKNSMGKVYLCPPSQNENRKENNKKKTTTKTSFMDRALTVACFALIEVDIDKYNNVCFCIIFNGGLTLQELIC